MKQKKLNNKGFSLVELIIVIAIMAVLIGLLAPQFLKYVQRSKYSTDVKNGQEIATVVQTLIADNALTTDETDKEFSASTAFAEAKNKKLMAETPVSKVSTANKFYVTYDVKSGKVTVSIGTAATGTGSSQIYPELTDEYKAKMTE